MYKLPKSERPPIELVFKDKFGHLPKSLIEMITLDVQNDCNCNVEIYDAYPNMDAIILYPGKIKRTKPKMIMKSFRYEVPIHKIKITKKDIELLLSSIDPLDPKGVLTCNLFGWGAFWPISK